MKKINKPLKTLNKKRCSQILKIKQSKWKNPQQNYCHAWQRLMATALHERIFIAAMLNPSLKIRYIQEFSRFSQILAISPLENKKRSKK